MKIEINHWVTENKKVFYSLKSEEEVINTITRLEEELTQLKQRLAEAESVIRFYDCHHKKIGTTVQSWSDDAFNPKYLGEIPQDDFELLQEGSDSCNMFLGKTARQYLEKYKDK